MVARIPLNALETNECLLDQGGPKNLNFSVICSYKGALSQSALEEGLQRLAEIHPLLQMTIEKTNDQYHFVQTQRRASVSAYPFESSSQWKKVVQTDLRRFEIEKEPLWRVSFLKGKTEGQILFTFYHAIADGPCAMKAVHHLFQILSAQPVSRQDTPLPPLESLYPLSPKNPLPQTLASPREPLDQEMCFEKKRLSVETTEKALAWGQRARTQGQRTLHSRSFACHEKKMGNGNL